MENDTTAKFKHRLRQVLVGIGWDDARLAAELRKEGYQISTQSTKRWWDGKSIPSGPMIAAIAKVTKCTTDRLLGVAPVSAKGNQ